jgi:hypothetical protein
MQVTGSLQTVATYVAVAHPFLQPISVGIQERTEALFLIFVSHFFQPSLQDFLVFHFSQTAPEAPKAARLLQQSPRAISMPRCEEGDLRRTLELSEEAEGKGSQRLLNRYVKLTQPVHVQLFREGDDGRLSAAKPVRLSMRYGERESTS